MKNAFISLIFGCGAVFLSANLAGAQTVDFELVAPSGLNLEFTGFASDEAELFREKPTELTTGGNLGLYKLRVAQDAVTSLTKWCVQVDSGDEDVQASVGAANASICNDDPEAVEGTIVFLASLIETSVLSNEGIDTSPDGAVLTALPGLPNSVACVQAQLNALGFEVGDADGIFGPKTEKGMAGFVTKAQSEGANLALPAFGENTASFWCAALAQIPAARPAFEAFIGINSGFTPYFANLILASGDLNPESGPQVLGNVTLLRRGDLYAVRISGTNIPEGFFSPRVRRGLDQTHADALLGQITDNEAVVALLTRGLARRELNYEADLKPALSGIGDILIGQVQWNQELTRYDLLIELEGGATSLYVVLNGPDVENAKLFAFAVMDRQ